MSKKFLGRTAQLYTTGQCKMNCEHCSSKLQKMPDMDLATFERVIRGVKANGAERIELFANDPILHPDILEQIDLLNQNGLECAILTVGPKDTSKENLFWRVAGKIDKEKGGFVFSVDLTEDSALAILESVEILKFDYFTHLYSYAVKAKIFWDLALFLQIKKIPVRINVVISRHTINEATAIMREAAEMGFAVSFCFVQNRMPKFDKLSKKGFTPRLERRFNGFMKASGLLNSFERKQIISEVREIIQRGELENSELMRVTKESTETKIIKSPFNCFRGNERSEGEIPENRLAELRRDILNLKSEMPDKILPNEDFIRRLGKRGFGCIELLRQEQFPQMKIGSEGQMIFCCDLHDPRTSSYSIDKLYEPEIRESFLKMIRTNPYIWLCLYFNPCDFSVNHVDYKVKS